MCVSVSVCVCVCVCVCDQRTSLTQKYEVIWTARAKSESDRLYWQPPKPTIHCISAIKSGAESGGSERRGDGIHKSKQHSNSAIDPAPSKGEQRPSPQYFSLSVPHPQQQLSAGREVGKDGSRPRDYMGDRQRSWVRRRGR